MTVYKCYNVSNNRKWILGHSSELILNVYVTYKAQRVYLAFTSDYRYNQGIIWKLIFCSCKRSFQFVSRINYHRDIQAGFCMHQWNRDSRVIIKTLWSYQFGVVTVMLLCLGLHHGLFSYNRMPKSVFIPYLIFQKDKIWFAMLQ